eukprot:c11993_g1_i1 orf=207-1940(+)
MALKKIEITRSCNRSIWNEQQPHAFSSFKNPVFSWATSTFVHLKSETDAPPSRNVYREDDQARELASALRGILQTQESSPSEAALLLSHGHALGAVETPSRMSTIDRSCSTFPSLKSSSSAKNDHYSHTQNETIEFAADALLPRRGLGMDWSLAEIGGLPSSPMNRIPTPQQDSAVQDLFQVQDKLFYVADSLSFTEMDSSRVEVQIQRPDPYSPAFEDVFSTLGSRKSDWAPESLDLVRPSNSSTEDSTNRFVDEDGACSREDVSEMELTSNRMPFIPSVTETSTNDSLRKYHATKQVLSKGHPACEDCHNTNPGVHNTAMGFTDSAVDEQPVLVSEQKPDQPSSNHEELDLYKSGMEGHVMNTMTLGRISRPTSVHYHVNSAFVPSTSSTSTYTPYPFPVTSHTSDSKATSVREMVYRVAALQPVNFNTETISRPKRKNVKISKDPQSIAARHRRERISDRIRILQRLVPGGMKMDTASMLEEAVHYIKFLKTELHTLENLGNTLNGTFINWAIQPNGHPNLALWTSTGLPNFCGRNNTSQPNKVPEAGDTVSDVQSRASFGQPFSRRLKQQSCH